jgi:hypothetical protein
LPTLADLVVCKSDTIESYSGAQQLGIRKSRIPFFGLGSGFVASCAISCPLRIEKVDKFRPLSNVQAYSDTLM